MKKKKKTKQVPLDYVRIEINGFDVHYLFIKYLEDKFNISVHYLEVHQHDKNTEDLLNSENNRYELFCEFRKKEEK